MSDAVLPQGTTVAAPAAKPNRLAAMLSHAHYVISGNPVTGFAFVLLVLIVIAALFGSFLVLGGICLLAMVQMRPPATPPPLPKTTQQALTTR